MSINTMAGLSIVSQASPIFQEMGKASAATAAGLVGIISIGNGAGRIFWAWVSDLTTRKTAFFLMYLVEVVLFWTYHTIGSLTVLGIVYVHPRDVLRGRLRHNSGVRGGLFWTSGRRLHFRLDDVALGICLRLRTACCSLIGVRWMEITPRAFISSRDW